MVQPFPFLSCSPSWTLKGEAQVYTGAQRLGEQSCPPHKSVTSRPLSPNFPSLHSCFIHTVGTEMQWTQHPGHSGEGGVPRYTWNSFVFQKHKNNHRGVCALCNMKLFRNCFVLGNNSHMIHHEMKSGKSFWINGPINSIEFPWQHRL